VIQPSTYAAIRFGYGFHPEQTVAADVGQILDGIGPASALEASVRWPERVKAGQSLRDANEARRAGEDGAEEAYRTTLEALRDLGAQDTRDLLAWPVASRHGFAERLVAFWADHFAIAAGNLRLRLMAPDLIHTAIRPHIGGRFDTMLKAVVTHPAMLTYLNQIQSVGPNSVAGRRRGRGLNENLAREIIELHTLGVDGGYTQQDVRGFAGLLTGLSVDQAGFRFRPGIAEPGTHAVLGKRYGGERPSLAHIEAALDDIAAHPDTGLHLARKLIVHFVGGPPPDDWARRMADEFRRSGGDLSALYAALLDDPRAWTPPFSKAKSPFEFIVSSLRAVGAGEDAIRDISARELRRGVVAPLEAMGQPLLRPPGPDGWDESPEAWITPPALAMRIRWGRELATRFLKDRDPRQFLRQALSDAASPTLEFAVNGAESRAEGNALVLASPEFNRR